MHSNCPISLKTFPPLQAEILAKAQSSRRPRAERPERGEKLRVNILKGVQWRASCHFAGLAGETMGPLSSLPQPRWVPAVSDDEESGEVRNPPCGEQEGANNRPRVHLLTRSKLQSAAQGGNLAPVDVKLAWESLDGLTQTSKKYVVFFSQQLWPWTQKTWEFRPNVMCFSGMRYLFCHFQSQKKDNCWKCCLVARRERLDHILDGYRTHIIIQAS